MVWISAIAFALLAAGVAMLVMGVRGRRVDDHPICRRCGRDLFALAQATARCPECGGEIDLQTGQFVRDGNRIRRPRMIAGGAVATMFGALMLFPILSDRAGWIRWYQHFPASWVMLDALDDDPRRRTIGLAELSRRGTAGLLQPEEFDAYIDAILKRQANLQSTWDERWGDIVETAILNGRLTDQARIDAYFVNGYRAVFTTRARQWLEAELPVELGFAWRTATDKGRFFRADVFRPWDISVEPKYPPTLSNDPASTAALTIWPAGGIRLPTPKDLRPGPAFLNLEWGFRYWPNGTQTVVHERFERVSLPIHLSDTPVVTRLHEPSAEVMKAAIQVTSWPGTDKTEIRLLPGSQSIPQSLAFTVECNVPVPVAFAVTVETEVDAVLIGRIVTPPTTRSFSFMQGVTPEQSHRLRGTRARVVLKSDPQTAEDRMLEECWEGEIVFEDVPIVTDR